MDGSRRLQCISYGLYRLVNDIIGPEGKIQIRRTVTNLRNDCNALYSTLIEYPIYRHLSGSYAEGFRFESSDKDFMFVFRHIIVTNNQEHYDIYRDNVTVLRMETDLCRPGFSLLRLEHILLSRDYDVTLVTRSCVQLPQGVYVSSSLWKQGTPKFIPHGELHGPCDSGMIGENEVDLAYCLRCHTWPKSAVGCINRLQRVGWPSAAVVSNILKEGCHLVAIGAKSSPYEDKEWRISFSFAEKTLIHNMNQCQFLCYGLLKIFLKEVMETGEKLICSYFLKTAVFWEICNAHTQWTSGTFLQCFWACFRRLISWVYNGYCPNFFIPENNMFYDKIQGRAQLELLSHLMVLYNEGYNTLLRCPSLQPLLGVIVNEPVLIQFLPSGNALYPNSFYAISTIVETINAQPREYFTLRRIQIVLQALSLLVDRSNELQSLSLRTWERIATQYLIVHSVLEGNYVHNSNNREMHHYMHSILRNLKRQSFDRLHHSVLSCLYLYRCGFYSIAVKVLLRAKMKLQRPDLMYFRNLSMNKYVAAGGEHTTLTTMMKKIMVNELYLSMNICVPELTMEHQASTPTKNAVFFPTLIIVNFLMYLSYYHLRQFADADAVIEELAMLLAFDEEQHIHPVFRAISWTMSGICQEMSGELTNAYHSYTAALNDRCNYFKESTTVRIENVLMKINNEHQ